MSIFNELLPKINEISNAFTKNFNDDLKAVFDCFDKFEEEFQNGRGKAREKATKDKNPMTTLQSIHEDEVKQEKISLPPEPMDTDSLPVDIPIKQEVNKDEIAMPPPVAPVPKPRKAAAKEKVEESSEDEGSGKRRTTRTRKQTDNKVSEVAPEPDKSTESQESVPASPAEKPRPKRTRRAPKAAEKPEEKQNTTPPPIPAPETNITPKEERISHPQPSSPILQKEASKNKSKKDPVVELTRLNLDEVDALDKTRVIDKVGDMDKTVVIPNGVYNHAPRNLNETVVLETANRGTMVLDKQQNHVMDATVVIDKGKYFMKREEKMAAAAAARETAERERRAALELAARERLEKQAHADQGKLDRLKEAERKKQELARKVAETEERRRAEEHARQQRLAEEQRRADEARRKQLEEAAAMKKEAAIMAKEIEKRQKEYIEKQKMKHKLEDKTHTPLKSAGTPGGWQTQLSPAYMADGFQYLNSDEDEEPVDRPVPEWSTSKARRGQLALQSQVGRAHVDRLFSVRVHSPDLRDIFPRIERARLKRTSSAVWHTPPARLPALAE
ncbi:hypothetical protein HF086_011105 [Spodoptera exigua]|uniref:Inner centromere protein ARK-binding domain-containing protein n=1 Tax=Spodoptera exigua TaxID=7107 RepID=A0A922MFW4_SPOEX|nr:hypothetical protein HF086_011105 [Spodoptera exigua]